MTEEEKRKVAEVTARLDGRLLYPLELCGMCSTPHQHKNYYKQNASSGRVFINKDLSMSNHHWVIIPCTKHLDYYLTDPNLSKVWKEE